MSDFSLRGGAADCLQAGFSYTTTLPTPITSSGSTNTVGSYVELLPAASNDRPITSLIVHCRPDTGGAQGDIMANIAIGAAASEVDIIENLWIPGTNGNGAVYQFDLPISIPSGVRISANIQASSASNVTMLSLQLTRGNLNANPLSSTITIGANTSTTDGVEVASGGTINTFGSWVEITSSLVEELKGFVIMCHKIDGSMTSMNQTYQVGVGAAASEEIIYSGHSLRPTDGEEVHGSIGPFVGVGIAQGERIAIRVQSTSTNADANMDFIILGMN